MNQNYNIFHLFQLPYDPPTQRNGARKEKSVQDIYFHPQPTFSSFSLLFSFQTSIHSSAENSVPADDIYFHPSSKLFFIFLLFSKT